MKEVHRLIVFEYLVILSVIQPARIQDIERHAASILPTQAMETVSSGSLRATHTFAREQSLVISVRQGVYCVAAKAHTFVRTAGLERRLDWRRMYLIKEQRKRFK